MSKIKYRVCDICGKQIYKTEHNSYGICIHHANFYRLWNRLFSGLDICTNCFQKIKRLSIDKKDEEKYIKEVFDKARNYDNPDLKSAYYEGIEDTLNVLSHKRLKNLQK